MRFAKKGFSLVETVIALGIFAFCIVVILGMIPVGMRSARSVADESNAVNIAGSILGIWDVAPIGSEVFPTNIFSTNNPSPARVGSAQNTTIFFDSEGKIASSQQSASLSLNYIAMQTNIPGNPSAFTVDLVFRWPPSASSSAVQSRVFSEVFSK